MPAQGATVGDGWGGRAGSPSKAAAAATRASSSGAASVPVGSAAAGGAALAGGRAHNGAPGPGGALAATPPDGTTTFCATREAALYRKVERLASAVALGRCAVAAELAGVAAAEAFELVRRLCLAGKA